ncbi:hypothetical protein [Levilactobacillus spicheri]
MRRKRRITLWGLLLLLVVGGCLASQSTPAAAATTTADRHVLIVYDAINPTVSGQKKLAAVQRLLASLNVKTQTERLSDYQTGQLTTQRYQGVVTLNNWEQGRLYNAAFVRDRNRFTGRQLHIGSGLSVQEAHRLGATRQRVYHQQFVLHDGGNWQLLPFSTDLTLLNGLSRHTQTFGTLRTQGAGLAPHAYGVVHGKSAYLPYLTADGFSLTVASRTLAALFGQSRTNRPLLTITGVTPYTNLARLRRLGQRLYQAGIPFAVSTTSVADNTTFRAFKRFAQTLSELETENGVIFLQAPVVGATNRQSGQLLEQLMVGQLNQLGQRQVLPVGISAPAYWNQDRAFRRHGLQRATNVLLLPNPATTIFAKQDNLGTTFTQTWYGLPLRSLQTVENGHHAPGDLSWAVPTALTVPMPDSAKGLTATLKQVTGLTTRWYDPSQQLTSRLTSTSATFRYDHGSYFLNGREIDVGNSTVALPRFNPRRKNHVALKGYFRVQGWILWIFFTIVLVILVIFIILGRRIYRRMFFQNSKRR